MRFTPPRRARRRMAGLVMPVWCGVVCLAGGGMREGKGRRQPERQGMHACACVSVRVSWGVCARDTGGARGGGGGEAPPSTPPTRLTHTNHTRRTLDVVAEHLAVALGAALAEALAALAAPGHDLLAGGGEKESVALWWDEGIASSVWLCVAWRAATKEDSAGQAYAAAEGVRACATCGRAGWGVWGG